MASSRANPDHKNVKNINSVLLYRKKDLGTRYQNRREKFLRVLKMCKRIWQKCVRTLLPCVPNEKGTVQSSVFCIQHFYIFNVQYSVNVRNALISFDDRGLSIVLNANSHKQKRQKADQELGEYRLLTSADLK